MTYQELIDNIRDLGFADDEEMEEFGELVPNSINRAITMINLELAPIIEKYEFDIASEDTGYIYIDMTDADDQFFEFADTPVLYSKDGTDFYKKFSNFEIEAENTIVINADENKGSFRVFYKVQHDKFTGTAAQLKEDLPLPLKAHHLVPLLAAYYVWLEDERAKAEAYFSDFENKKNAYLAEQMEGKTKVRVLYGGI